MKCHLFSRTSHIALQQVIDFLHKRSCHSDLITRGAIISLLVARVQLQRRIRIAIKTSHQFVERGKKNLLLHVLYLSRLILEDGHRLIGRYK